MIIMKNYYQTYLKLLKNYGNQGWWPINEKYNLKNDSEKNNLEKYEICIGAILTQNTSWKQVEISLDNLRKLKLIDPKRIFNEDINIIKQAIKPSGYYNQKSIYLKEFTNFFLNLKTTPKREELLNIKGIGKETADSILLYAYNLPYFIVDTYTKRIFNFDKNTKYDAIKNEIESNIPKDYKIYQEFHALIVKHEKTSKSHININLPIK